MSRYLKAAVLSSLALCVALVAVYFLLPSKVTVPDRLCDYISDTLHFTCVDVLQAEDGMHPGAVSVLRDPKNKNERQRAELPRLDLLRESCRVPGTEAATALPDSDTRSQIGLPTFTYELDGALKEGLEIPVPKLEGATISAGPNFSRVSRAAVTNEKSWVVTWDEAAAARAFASCNIQQACVERIRSAQYKVVSSAAVVEGLGYEFSDRNGKSVALGGEAEALKIRTGGTVTISEGTTAKLEAKAPYVVGVRFFPDTVFAKAPACAEPATFGADGSATVTVSGGGGKGQIGGPFTVNAPLGQPASLNKMGGEESECESGLDLTGSRASATAQVDSPKPGTLAFSYEYALSGGHYATVDACPFGKWVGKHGHDNSATVSLSLAGRVHVVLRTQGDRVIRVTTGDLPATSVRVVDPYGKIVDELRRPQPKEGPPLPSGSQFNLKGPGAYTVEYAAQLNFMEGGAGQSSKSSKDLLEVHLQ
jgi:hypothetical protein